MKYAIEQLTGNGYWEPLRQSSEATGFTLAPHPTFATHGEAEAHIAELRAAGTWRGLRVAEVTS